MPLGVKRKWVHYACLIEAAKIIERVDPTVNPCENFYKFACGNYMKNEEAFANVLKEIHYEIKELYFEPIKEGEHYMVKSEKKLLHTCLNVTAIREDKLTTIKEGLKELGGWPVVEGSKWDESRFDWLETTYKLRELGYPFEIFLGLSVTINPSNYERQILKISLPSYEDSQENNTREIMMNDALLFGADAKFASKDIDEMYNLQQKLKMSEHSVEYDVFTLNEIQKKITDVNWLEFINKLSGPAGQISLNENVMFPLPESLRKRLDIISSTSKRTQANFLIWRVILLIKSYVTVKPQLGNSRVEYCLELVRNRYIPNPMFVMYLRKLIPRNKKSAAELIILNTRNALLELLNKVDWLENEQKQKLKDRIEHMTVVIVKYGNYLDDKELDDMNVDMRNISKENFLNLLFQAERNRRSQIYSHIHKVKDKIPSRGISEIPQILRYSRNTNLLYVSALVLRNRIFNENNPNYLNYGLFGTEIGKQLSDIFGDVVRKVHKDEEKINESQARLEKLEKCIIEDMKDNGMTPKNNILAFALQTYRFGPKLSYDAYTKWTQSNGEEQELVGIDYTPNQLFWISSVTCKAENPLSLELSFFVKTFPDHYSHLVNTSLRQQPEFARDFNCPVGSPLNPINRCDTF